jgi:hypothetical protein
MNSVLDLLAANLYDQLTSAHSLDVIDMLFKGMSATLSMEDIQTLKRESMINAINGASTTIANTMTSIDALTFVVFITSLLAIHEEKKVERETIGQDI